MSVVGLNGAKVELDRRPYGVWERSREYCRRDPEGWKKLAALCLRVDGWPDTEIAAVLACELPQITQWVEELKDALLADESS